VINDKPCEAFERAKFKDATVARMLAAGCGAEEIIGQLADDKEAYLKEVLKLSTIAPRKVTLPDGRVVVWHCPDHLIPS